MNEPETTNWSSEDVLGESPLFLLLYRTGSQRQGDGEAGLLGETFKVAADSSSVFAVVTASEVLLKRIKTAFGLGKVMLLWDEEDTVCRELALQARYGTSSDQSSLLVIDRAGWLRRVENLSNAAQIGTLLKTIGDPTPQLEVGQRAPDFALPDMNGVPRRPADLWGKKHLLLTFFPKCFTGTCSKQLESLRDAQKELQSEDVEVWAVSVDPADGEKGQRAFAKQLGLWFPLLPDTGRNLSLLYGAVQSPNQTSSRMSVLIDKQGVVRWIDKQINPTTHGQDVVAKVHTLNNTAAR